jgi:hypothetical protein
MIGASISLVESTCPSENGAWNSQWRFNFVKEWGLLFTYGFSVENLNEVNAIDNFALAGPPGIGTLRHLPRRPISVVARSRLSRNC